HECINTRGSFYCVCNPGYVLTGDTECIDIDECSDGTSGCQQKCSNTFGSFTCSCEEGFTTSLDDAKLCEIVQGSLQPCTDIGLNCEYGCRSSISTPECFCQRGFTFENQERCIG
ncbi:unnamed protein product, partial [Owenia fusiformis]